MIDAITIIKAKIATYLLILYTKYPCILNTLLLIGNDFIAESLAISTS